MSGCISVSGDHPIYAERSGFGSQTVDGVIKTLQRLTKRFQKLPNPQLGQSAREGTVQSVSFEKFTSQLTALLKSFY